MVLSGVKVARLVAAFMYLSVNKTVIGFM